MIVKKTPILQNFPVSEIVNNLSLSPSSRSIFLDIETNGLSPRSHFVYLIGALDFSDNSFQLCQWFAQSPEEEPEILAAFQSFAEGYHILVHFNGNRFDLPFLEKRYQRHNMPSFLSAVASYDLCRELKDIQALTKLANRKFSTAEEFLGLTRENDCSGRECINLYQRYYATGDDAYLEPILYHNRMDLEHLPALFSLLNYRQIQDGNFTLQDLQLTDQGLAGQFQLEEPVPRLISYQGTEAYLTAEERVLKVFLPLSQGRLKLYHSPCREYYYLPEEDSAVHKSVGIYVDKSRRKAATPQTCYTWFSVTPEFLENTAQSEPYFRKNLRFLLGFF